MAISSEFRMKKYRDDDHWEDAPNFTITLHYFVYEIHIMNNYMKIVLNHSC